MSRIAQFLGILEAQAPAGVVERPRQGTVVGSNPSTRRRLTSEHERWEYAVLICSSKYSPPQAAIAADPQRSPEEMRSPL